MSDNINLNPKQAYLGMNLDSLNSQIKEGEYAYCLNGKVNSFNGLSVTIQNEEGNTLCTNFPAGLRVIGVLNILEKDLIVFWLVSPDNVQSEIGTVNTRTCIYKTIINASCLKFKIERPILKAVYKTTNCSTEVYWTDPIRRYINLENLPWEQVPGESQCENIIEVGTVDCNLLSVQPNFSIPDITITEVDADGTNLAGTYQFAIQYSNALGEPYTSYYSITNPVSLFDPFKVTQDFNYPVNKSIVISIDGIDQSGYYDYFNIAVIKTVNAITSVELVGTYRIMNSNQTINYTGQNKEAQRLTVNDVFEKYPVYDTAEDVTTVQDVLIWSQLTSTDRLNYQSIASNITLKWQTFRVSNTTPYANAVNTATIRGYMRDEIYPFAIVFLLKNGYQTDAFHIPSRLANSNDTNSIFNDDVIDPTANTCNPPQAQPTWKVYNTAYTVGDSTGVGGSIPDTCYEGPFEYGEFSYWESTEKYPCDPNIWGELANQPIRHHKFPDNLIAPINDSDYVYPIGLKIDLNQITDLINTSDLTIDQKSRIQGFKIVRGDTINNKSVIAKGLMNNVGVYTRGTVSETGGLAALGILAGIGSEIIVPGSGAAIGTAVVVNNSQPTIKIEDNVTYFYPNYPFNDLRSDPFISSTPTVNASGISPNPLAGFSTDDSKIRFTFHSPDTSFYQPSLGNILKLETAIYGIAQSHFVPVLDHAKYKIISGQAYRIAVGIAASVGFLSVGFVQVFNGSAAMQAFTVLIDIVQKIIPKLNFAYQYNAIGNYSNFIQIPNEGYKQRNIDIASYAVPGMVSFGDKFTLNNFQRESSIYIRTTGATLPFPSQIPGVPIDTSRYILGEISNCDVPDTIVTNNISAYYGAIKVDIPDQYGQIDQYDIIDTGYQVKLPLSTYPTNQFDYIFGGDTFINKFAYKSKLPFFIDNRVNAPDESDIFYNEIGNIAYPNYWFSSDTVGDTGSGGGGINNFGDGIFGVKATNFDCSNNETSGDLGLYKAGKMYLFAYGIPYYWCESRVNVDMRQAYDNKVGDFYPHVGNGIPDSWLQEKYVSIANDNSYWYNKSYSKQNEENLFTTLPEDFKTCSQVMPYRCIYTEQQLDIVDYRRNNWLIVKPVSYFDFPQNFGKLTSLDGIENKAVLARFENKSMFYNTLLTINTSNPQAAYLGNDTLFKSSPPIDLTETDLGYLGSQNKFLLKTEYGHVTVDAKRGQIFLLNIGSKVPVTVLTERVDKFFTEYLSFKILSYFPEADTDNAFNGCGITGVYDAKYNRFLITKLDYIPIIDGISLENGDFKFNNQIIQLTDPIYFCNNSFTASYSFDSQSWISFHTYLPNFYVGNNNWFYTGLNEDQASLWTHNTSITLYNNFYGDIQPYVIEYPYSYKLEDEILQSIKDYSRVLEYTSWQSWVETDDIYFNKAILYSGQSCSGILELAKKPYRNLQAMGQYPVYNTDSKTIIYTKSDSFYNFNTFWDVVRDKKQPIWNKSCTSVSIFKELNQDNMAYSKRTYLKAPIRSKELNIRLINDKYDNVQFLNLFTITDTQKSYK